MLHNTSDIHGTYCESDPMRGEIDSGYRPRWLELVVRSGDTVVAISVFAKDAVTAAKLKAFADALSAV
jgi:hypothetical protein